MKIFKKISLILCCLVFVFALSGCANVQFERIINTDGSIIDAVCVKLDENAITQNGFNIDTVKNDIKLKMNQYINAFFTSFQQRNDNLSPLKKIDVNNKVTANVFEENGYIVASLSFKNYETFKYFYGLHLIESDETDEDDSNVVETFLYNKNVSIGKTIFSTKDAEFITDDFLSYFNNAFTLSDAELSYVFGTPQGKLHSDATNEYEIDGVHYHEWIVTDINQEILTYTIGHKPVNYYILALILTVVLIIILFVIAFFKRKKVPETPSINK